MQNINIIFIGNLKEKYLVDAVKEYEKRLGAFCKLNDIYIKEELLPSDPSETEIKNALEKEAVNVLAHIPKKSYKIAMCVEGKAFSSEELAKCLDNCAQNGFSDITFIIGSSFGLSDTVKAACDLRLSVSKMTFTHQMMRFILAEQIYRAFSINNHGKYHK